MGRRKKASPEVHRSTIAYAAQCLFMRKGIAATTMDEIAQEANYSKATLYVYFKNKEDLVSVLVLKSITLLYEYICTAVTDCGDTKAQYLAICYALVRYQEQFPFYFSLALDEIHLPAAHTDPLACAKETFAIGEKINLKMAAVLASGVQNHHLRQEIPILPTVFLFWASLTGIMQLSANKAAYIHAAMGMTRPMFLTHSFDTLYRAIQNDSVNKSYSEEAHPCAPSDF